MAALSKKSNHPHGLHDLDGFIKLGKKNINKNTLLKKLRFLIHKFLAYTFKSLITVYVKLNKCPTTPESGNALCRLSFHGICTERPLDN